MEENKEVVTLFDIILKATKGDTKDLEQIIIQSNQERNNLIVSSQQKVSEMNAQIQLLNVLLEQAKINKNKEEVGE